MVAFGEHAFEKRNLPSKNIFTDQKNLITMMIWGICLIIES